MENVRTLTEITQRARSANNSPINSSMTLVYDDRVQLRTALADSQENRLLVREELNGTTAVDVNFIRAINEDEETAEMRADAIRDITTGRSNRQFVRFLINRLREDTEMAERVRGILREGAALTDYTPLYNLMLYISVATGIEAPSQVIQFLIQMMRDGGETFSANQFEEKVQETREEVGEESKTKETEAKEKVENARQQARNNVNRATAITWRSLAERALYAATALGITAIIAPYVGGAWATLTGSAGTVAGRYLLETTAEHGEIVPRGRRGSQPEWNDVFGSFWRTWELFARMMRSGR